MKRINIFLAAALAVTALLGSCRPQEKIADDIEIPGLGGTEEVWNDMDEWLYDNFTEPYNIEVVYRWNAAKMYSSLSGAKLVPVMLDRIKPVMAAIRDVWFEPYAKASADGYDFLKMYAPKEIVLVGSPEYGRDGTVTLGQAEGGRKILLLNINNFDAASTDIDNPNSLVSFLHVIEHEFGHVLHQTKLFDTAYQKISVGRYNPSGWDAVSNEDAYKLGFCSNYSMSGKDEDFVEVLSLVLVNGYDWFENTLLPIAATSTANPRAAADLVEKLDIVDRYMRSAWNIQYLDNPVLGTKGLESYVQEAIAAVSANPPIE